jgi:Flp pilus assembly protein TadG
MKIRSKRGNTILEVAVLTPVIAMLLVGMTQIAQITWIYYTLRKAVYTTATYLSNQQGVNFCDPGDPAIAAAISFGVTGTTDSSQPAVVDGLTAGMIQVTPEAFDSAAQAIGTYPCGNTSSAPDYIVVSIPDGYPVRPVIPFFSVIDTIALKPRVKVPYGGT